MKKIAPGKFSAEYSKIKDKLLKTFCDSIKITDKNFTLFVFRSYNPEIQNVLTDIKNKCLNKLVGNKISFNDISDCLIKKKGKPRSLLHSFNSIISAYDFNSNVLVEQKISFIKNLIIIDDVFSMGKAVFTLLKNLYEYGLINETTLVDVNCNYCVEERFKHLF